MSVQEMTRSLLSTSKLSRAILVVGDAPGSCPDGMLARHLDQAPSLPWPMWTEESIWDWTTHSPTDNERSTVKPTSLLAVDAAPKPVGTLNLDHAVI